MRCERRSREKAVQSRKKSSCRIRSSVSLMSPWKRTIVGGVLLVLLTAAAATQSWEMRP
jgi:hypothetical protein